MADESMVDEMMDVGSGLNDALGCAVAGIFYMGGLALFASIPLVIFSVLV